MTPIHALLVGVDGYEPERFPDSQAIPHLTGAVNDVLRMREFLVDGPPSMPDDRIRTLISPSPFSGRPRPPVEDLPTLANLRREIEALGDRASAGDQVLVHFSGHGARVPSEATTRKQEAGWDECLAPSDVGVAGFLRDWEIHELIHGLAELGLHPIVVLDCCHSGGAFRGPAIRRLEPTWSGPSGIGRLPRQELPGAGEGGRLSSAKRNLVPSAGWWPAPPGSVLLAACLPTELAREKNFPGVGVSGALTHHLLEATSALGARATYRDLHRLLLARIHVVFPSQTPVIEGDTDLAFLGLDRWPGRHGVTVMDTQWRRGTPWLYLATGLSQAVATGARLSLHRLGGGEDPDGEAEIVEAGGAASWARAELAPGEKDATGWSAVVVDPGPRALVRRVAVFPLPEPGDGSEGETETARGLLDAVREALAGDRAPWLEPAGEGGADLGVSWASRQGLVVTDGAGEPVPFQGEALRSPETLLDRLTHLARYAVVRALENPDGSSRLRDALHLELVRLDPEWPGGPSVATPLSAGEGVLCGEEIELRIRNRSDLDLQVAVLDVQPDWGISQVHPRGGGAALLAAGGETVSRLGACMPFEAAECHDLLKVIATTEPVDFSWLTLPALDGTGASRRTRGAGGPEGPLEELFARLTADRPATRSMRVVAPAGGEWTVTEVELRVVRTEAVATG